MFPVHYWPEIAARAYLAPADPAAGNPINYAYLGPQYLHILHINFRLVTDATAVQRQPYIAIEWGGFGARRHALTGVQAPSTTRDYDAAMGVGGAIVPTNTYYQAINIPFDYILAPGLSLVISAYNIQAGDQFSACFLHGRYYPPPT